MTRVGISLGTNLGERLANLREAAERLRKLAASAHWLASSVFETEPVACAEKDPAFLNCVIEFECDLAPEELLEHTQQIESDLGRPEKRAINAPRPIDVDILYIDGIEIVTKSLTLPHPRMMERAFVLVPLQEIRPDLVAGTKLINGEGVIKWGDLEVR
ncbi:MAG: 2-amino-4-hydroxy-6-hydroxymethyldihydropteridine diphosphokinase [Verrucomicrobiales bacterium]|jgi:2-amino-4-hydroxy-6-hydroxymethyldihydropteridine diphosphokinase